MSICPESKTKVNLVTSCKILARFLQDVVKSYKFLTRFLQDLTRLTFSFKTNIFLQGLAKLTFCAQGKKRPRIAGSDLSYAVGTHIRTFSCSL